MVSERGDRVMKKTKFKVHVNDERDKEAYTRIEYKPVKKNFRGSTRQLDLPNESMCSPSKKGEEDSWDADTLCPTRSKKKTGRI
jgi:hypothetical protein